MSKSVLITGGSSGIGAATARAAAQRGWVAYIGYHTGYDRAVALAEEIRLQGGTAFPVPIRLAENSDFAEAFQIITEKTKTLEGLILAASPAPQLSSFLKTESQDLLSQFQVNGLANHRLLVECWKRFFRPLKKGHVVGVLSAAALKEPWPHMTSYVMGKRVLLSILESSAAELGTSGLHVSVIYPDYTETPMWADTHPLVLDAARSKRPGRQFLDPLKVAHDILQLLESAPKQNRAVQEKIILGKTV